MSEKREKQVRRIARQRYKFDLMVWYSHKPSRWRIFRYRKWKKAMPTYTATEKKIKNIAKKRG